MSSKALKQPQQVLILRPPPHRDFLSGHPGIPALTPPSAGTAPPSQDPLLPLPLNLRPQAHLSGTVEVTKRIKSAAYLTVELEKLETLPGVKGAGDAGGKGGGGTGKEKITLTELIGMGPGTLWVPGQGSEIDDGVYGDIPEGSYPFRIPLPEGLPPTSEVDLKGSGIRYQLMATLSVKGKRGLLKSSPKPLLMTASSPINLVKADILPVWPIYSPVLPLPLPPQLPWAPTSPIEGGAEPIVTGEVKEAKAIINGGEGGEVWMKCVRERGAAGPGDAVRTRVQVGWGGQKPIKLVRLDFVLRETLIFRYPAPITPNPPPRHNSIFTASASVSADQSNPTAFAILYPSSPLTFNLVGVIPASHSRVTIRSAKHVEVGYHLKIRAMMEGGEECSVDGWSLVVGSLGWREALGLVEDIGFVDGLCERQGLEGRSKPSGVGSTPGGATRAITTQNQVARLASSLVPPSTTTATVPQSTQATAQRPSMLFPTTSPTLGTDLASLTTREAPAVQTQSPSKPPVTTTAFALPSPQSQAVPPFSQAQPQTPQQGTDLLSLSESRPQHAPPPPPKTLSMLPASAEEEKRRLYLSAKTEAEEQQRMFRIRNGSGEDNEVGSSPAVPSSTAQQSINNEHITPPSPIPAPPSTIPPRSSPSFVSPIPTSPQLSPPLKNVEAYYNARAEDEKIRLFKEAEQRRTELQAMHLAHSQTDEPPSPEQDGLQQRMRLAEDGKVRLHLDAVKMRDSLQESAALSQSQGSPPPQSSARNQSPLSQYGDARITRETTSSPTPSHLSVGLGRSATVSGSLSPASGEKKTILASAKALARQRQEEARLEYERQRLEYERQNALLEQLEEEERIREEEEELEAQVKRLQDEQRLVTERLEQARRRREGNATLSPSGSGAAALGRDSTLGVPLVGGLGGSLAPSHRRVVSEFGVGDSNGPSALSEKEELQRRRQIEDEERQRAEDHRQLELRQREEEARRLQLLQQQQQEETERRQIQEAMEMERRVREEELRVIREREEEEKLRLAKEQAVRAAEEQFARQAAEARRQAEQARQAEERRNAEMLRDRLLAEQQQYSPQQVQSPPSLIQPPYGGGRSQGYDRPLPPPIPQQSYSSNSSVPNSDYQQPYSAQGYGPARPPSGQSFAPSTSLDNADTDYYMNAIGSSLARMTSDAAAKNAYLDSIRQRSHQLPAVTSGYQLREAPSITSFQNQASSPQRGASSTASPTSPSQPVGGNRFSPLPLSHTPPMGTASYIATPHSHSPEPSQQPLQYTQEPERTGMGGGGMSAEMEKQVIAARYREQDERAEREAVAGVHDDQNNDVRAGKQPVVGDDGPPSYPVDAPVKQLTASEEKLELRNYYAAKAAVDDYARGPPNPPPRPQSYHAYPQPSYPQPSYPPVQPLNIQPQPFIPHQHLPSPISPQPGYAPSGPPTSPGRGALASINEDQVAQNPNNAPETNTNTTPTRSARHQLSSSQDSTDYRDRDPAITAGKRRGQSSPTPATAPPSGNDWYSTPAPVAPASPPRAPSRSTHFDLDFGNFTLGDALAFDTLGVQMAGPKQETDSEGQSEVSGGVEQTNGVAEAHQSNGVANGVNGETVQEVLV